ncbi:MAG: hypothetical protein EP330_28035 [Deltaproteobacteria bacterium]|nr:MAG: hypothetical protein EP330_28035 [Deltaproteobacteria bacterium]
MRALPLLLAACAANVHESPPCDQPGRILTCSHETTTFLAGDRDREVHFQVPVGEPPDEGFPAVFLLQGALFSGEGMWQAHQRAAIGGYHQTRTVEALLANGFAVITPEAPGDGITAWNTNVPPHAGNWENSPDAELFSGMLTAVEDGDFGPLNADALYAGGISSGGYATSRLAEQFPGRFRALAIHSASWATCAGAACVLPDTLPEDHPPTLFLHGGLDAIVPPHTSKRYHRRLDELGVDTEREVQPFRTHRWLDIAPDRILGWFESH